LLEVELHDDLRYRLRYGALVEYEMGAAEYEAVALRTSSGRSSSCATTSSATSRRQALALARTLELRVGRRATRSIASKRLEPRGRGANAHAAARADAQGPAASSAHPDAGALGASRTSPRRGPSSIYELAKQLGRDYKNVHTEVSRLADLGLIERKEGEVAVAWDAVRVELRF